MSKGLQSIQFIEDLEYQDKVVFLRVDFNVPMNEGQITDDLRIRKALPTIKYLLDHGAKLVLASHFGRPKTEEDRARFSLEPVAQHLSELIGREVILVDDPESEAPKGLLPGFKGQELILLENLRFAKGETKNAHELASHWASYIDIYINDAFGASHRAHASIDELPRLMEKKAMGYLIQKEVSVIDQLLEEPNKPFWAILGGAKVSDKIKVIERLADLVDGLVIGGAMAYTFLKAQDVNVGDSLVEKESLQYARELTSRFRMREKKLLLPVDHKVATEFKASAESRVTETNVIDDGWMGMDIGPKTIELFSQELSQAGTLFWNGPMGVFEMEPFSEGTFSVAQVLAKGNATTIVGGGDSAAAALKSGLADKMTHISTGGGASLEYLQGERLPGLEALRSRV